MPAVHFDVRWPDGSLERCYSPSRAIKEHLQAGASYPLEDFVAHSRDALELAGERVRLRYGFACSSAAEQLARIEARARTFDTDPTARVTVVRFDA